ncbi:MAG: DUF4352 domain-containing protein [Chloroflexota bacterium]|nr:DUF4352 domain-containing protein [Chloroflexota bacterium]
MNRQKVVFSLIVGSAVIFVGISAILRGGLGPPDLDATATAEANRATVTPAALLSGVLSGAQTWNGLRIEVVEVKADGWLLVEAHNQYNESPLPGKRMLLITVQVQTVSETEEPPISIDESDFKVVGERGVVYTTYSQETRCGVVPDKLDGVVTADHSISGAICVQAPEDEGGFILIYDTGMSTEPAVYIPLPEED